MHGALEKENAKKGSTIESLSFGRKEEEKGEVKRLLNNRWSAC